MSESTTTVVAVSPKQSLLAAAVAGTLTVQPQPAKPGIRPVGMVTGLPVALAWAYQFQLNERRPATEKLSDEAILVEMYKDFPSNDSACFRNLKFQRAYYNAGKSCGGHRPRVQSTQAGSAAAPAVPVPPAAPAPAAAPTNDLQPADATPNGVGRVAAPEIQGPPELIGPKPLAKPVRVKPLKASLAAARARRKASEEAAAVSV